MSLEALGVRYLAVADYAFDLSYFDLTSSGFACFDSTYLYFGSLDWGHFDCSFEIVDLAHLACYYSSDLGIADYLEIAFVRFVLVYYSAFGSSSMG